METEKVPSINPLLKFANSINGYIETKYAKDRISQDEARADALTFAASQCAWLKVEPFFTPEYCDPGDETIVQKLGDAIDRALQGDWSQMKTALQNYAQLSLSNSTLSEFLANQQENSLLEEKKATAFINLANSV